MSRSRPAASPQATDRGPRFPHPFADQTQRILRLVPPALDPDQHWTANFYSDCALWLTLARAQRQTPFQKWVIPRGPCQCGLPGKELDNRTPIALASLGTPKY